MDERNHGVEWQAFSKPLRRLIHDGIRLRKRHDFDLRKYRSRIRLIHRRLQAGGRQLQRCRCRTPGPTLSRYRDQLFTFLDTAGVPPDNNHAERQIRPAVIIRKNSLCNRSEEGARTQAVLMSVYRTLRLRAHDPTQNIAAAYGRCFRPGHCRHCLRKALQTGEVLRPFNCWTSHSRSSTQSSCVLHRQTTNGCRLICRAMDGRLIVIPFIIWVCYRFSARPGSDIADLAQTSSQASYCSFSASGITEPE